MSFGPYFITSVLKPEPQCSSAMVSRKKICKICHYTHHFISCFPHWNLVSNKYFHCGLLRKSNFSDFQYWKLAKNGGLRGEKVVFWVSLPYYSLQTLKINFCFTIYDMTKNFYKRRFTLKSFFQWVALVNQVSFLGNF